MDFKAAIRTIPDHPKPGIQFRDVTSLMSDAAAFRAAVEAMCAPWASAPPEQVAGIDARGFILGGAMAAAMGAGFVPLRKAGKLPARTLSERYALEYGEDELHIHADAFAPGTRVLLTDDLIATGGTAKAGLSLLRRAGADVVGASFLVDLPDLGGGDALRAEGVEVHVLASFAGH